VPEVAHNILNLISQCQKRRERAGPTHQENPAPFNEHPSAQVPANCPGEVQTRVERKRVKWIKDGGPPYKIGKVISGKEVANN